MLGTTDQTDQLITDETTSPGISPIEEVSSANPVPSKVNNMVKDVKVIAVFHISIFINRSRHRQRRQSPKYQYPSPTR